MQQKIQQRLMKQRAYFSSGVTKDLAYRVVKLKVLKKWIQDHDEKITAALHHDLGKGEFEAYTSEVMGVISEIDLMLKKMAQWAKPKKVKTPLILFKANSEIIYEPFGTVLVMSPWNYPFSLSIITLVGVIAAGNCCVLKPSEIASHTSQIIVEMIQACFEEEYCFVFEGGVEETTELLKERFDFIHFTGSTEVGKIVALAAARHLTPVVLELGGKSPCIVDETADIEVTARRICWGKFMNAGQTCIAPDFIFVHQTVKDQLIKALEMQIKSFYGEDAQQSEDYGRIINEKHFDRLTSLLSEGDVVCGGNSNREQLYIAPTIIDHVQLDHAIMQGEIFGPLLPILTYDEVPDMISTLKKCEKPLSLYLFSKNKSMQEKITKEISFGGGCMNATILHIVNPNLPFGGIGYSGMGSYHGSWSFEAFSHQKSILSKSFRFDFQFLYPPYKGKLKWLKRLL